MNRELISVQRLVQDVKSGFSDCELMERYCVSASKLVKIFDRLVHWKIIEQTELDIREAIFERADARRLTAHQYLIASTDSSDCENLPSRLLFPKFDRQQLITTVNYGHTAELVELLSYKFDLEIRDSSGSTPLMLAAQHGNREMVEILLSHGADPCARDILDKTPAYLAAENGHYDLSEFLQKHMVFRTKLKLKELLCKFESGLAVPDPHEFDDSLHSEKIIKEDVSENNDTELCKSAIQQENEAEERNNEDLTAEEHDELTIEALKNEQYIFYFGIIGTLCAAAGMLFFVSKGQSFLQVDFAGSVAVYIGKLCMLYFVARFSRALRQPIWLTILWCVLTLIHLLFLVPVIGLLVSLISTKRRLRNSSAKPPDNQACNNLCPN